MKPIKRALLAATAMALLCAGALPAAGQEIIKKGGTVKLQDCLEIALRQSPALGGARAAAQAAGNKVDEARSNYYPQVSLSSGYARKSVPSSTTSTGRTASSAGDSVDSYTANAALTQNILDFGKTSAEVDIQRLNYESSKKDLENSQSQIAFNVKQAYYKALQAKRGLEIAEATLQQFQEHLVQAKGFYEAGTKSKIDVTKAAVDVSNAELSRIKAANALQVAMAGLNNAMGIIQTEEYNLEDNLSFTKYELPFEDALERAYKNRPDLRSVAAKMRSAERGIDLAKKGYYPKLTGDAEYNWSGQTFPLDKSWTVGATLTIPIFSGFLTKYQVEESRASLDVARANAEVIRQAIFLDMRQAYLNLADAAARIPTAELTVKQTEENLELAKQRYASGIGSPLEVTDAQILDSNARNAYNQALYDYKISTAGIDKAMGER